jgi:hypothetical protein
MIRVEKRNLLSTIRVPLTLFHVSRINMIDCEDFSGVRRKVSEDLSKLNQKVQDDHLDEGILALKQYYAVALLDPVNKHAVSDAIDPFWHAHILHTARYIAFCNAVFGQYIQHEPLDHRNAGDVAHIARLYQHTVAVYRDMFYYISPHFYPEEVSDAQLVCKHQAVQTVDVRQRALFPSMQLAA